MLRSLAIALSLAFVLTASPAQAGWKIQRAQAIAANVWHHPCNDRVTLTWAPLDDPARVAEAYVDECRIVLVTDPTPWVEFCTTMIHEYGHLAGFRDPSNVADPMHSSNRHSVMATNTRENEETALLPHRKPLHIYTGLDRRCADHGRTYLHMKPDSLARRETFR